MSRKATLYDLSTPAPMPREAERRFEAQRVSLAEHLRVHLRRLLRLRVEASVGSADVARVRQFVSDRSGSFWWYSGGSVENPDDRSVLLAVAPDLVYAAIDRVLGGTGQAKATGKPPTDIEFEFGMRFMRELLAGIAAALQLPPLQLSIVPRRALAESPLTFMPDLEEPFARIPWRVKLFDAEHELLLCVSRRLLASSEPKPEEAMRPTEEMQAPLANAPLELMAELARCRLTLDEAGALQKGDVVLFELPPGEPIEVQVQGKPRFRAKLGTHEGRYAISITQLIEPATQQSDVRRAATAATPATATATTPPPATAPAATAPPSAEAATQSRAAAAGAARPATSAAAPRPRAKAGA
jgi:flagellar motor switch protein FliM